MSPTVFGLTIALLTAVAYTIYGYVVNRASLALVQVRAFLPHIVIFCWMIAHYKRTDWQADLASLRVLWPLFLADLVVCVILSVCWYYATWKGGVVKMASLQSVGCKVLTGANLQLQFFAMLCAQYAGWNC